MTNYDIIAGHFSHTRKYVWDDLKPFLEKIKKNSQVLDLGCGNGRVLSILQDKKIDYLGIDLSKQLIGKAKKNYPNYNFIQGDIKKSNTFLKLNNYDYVLLFAVLHHILDKKEQSNLFKNIYKVLKPKAKLFLTTWNMYQNKYKDKIDKNKIALISYSLSDGKKVIKKEYRQIRAFKSEEIKKLAKNAGLEIKSSFYSKKGKKADRNMGYNLCFEMEKMVK